MTGPFTWTVSDGSVNLPVSVAGGSVAATSYYVVGANEPVPNSAAEFAFLELSKKADITIISIITATEIHFACTAVSLGWGSDTPAYDVPPANTSENLAAAATQMQAAVRALGQKTVYVTVGAANQATAPVTAVVDLSTVTVTEVSFALV